MKILTMYLGEIYTDSYLLINEDLKELIIVDPADDAETIIKNIEDEKCVPKAILLTHGHWDHFLAAKEVADHYDIPIVCEEEEKELLGDPEMNLTYRHFSGPVTIIPDITVKDGDEITFAGMKAKVLHTPGHTGGSCCYYFKDENVLISGDTMFQAGYGRVDFPTGSMKEIARSLKRLCDELPEETDVYPGHGMPTTIGYEKKRYDFAYM